MTFGCDFVIGKLCQKEQSPHTKINFMAAGERSSLDGNCPISVVIKCKYYRYVDIYVLPNRITFISNLSYKLDNYE